MPHLYFQQRYWRISDDDLFLPVGCTIIGRTCWTVLIILYFLLDYRQLYVCTTGILLFIYLLVTIICLVFLIIMDLIIMFTSLKGTIVDGDKRSSMNLYLSLRLIMSYFQVFAAIYGIIAITYAQHIPCNGNLERTITNRAIYIVIICSQFIDICLLTCCGYLTSSSLVDEDENHQDEQREEAIEEEDIENGSIHRISPLHSENGGVSNKSSSIQHPRHKDYDRMSLTERWENRFEKFLKQVQFYSCNLLGSGNINGELQDVAKVLTKFFHHDGFLDVVPSDIIAGIILVRSEQKWRRKTAFEEALRKATSENTSTNLIQDNDQNNETMEINANNNNIPPSPPAQQSPTNRFSEISIQSYQHTERKIATLPTGALRTIAIDSSAGNIYNTRFLESLRKYIIYSSLIYNQLVLVKNNLDQPINNNCLSCLCNCSACMPPDFEGVKVNYFYLYGNRIHTRSEHQHAPSMQPSPNLIEGINFYAVNHSLMQSEELEQSELIHISFQSDLLHKPYAIFLDHKEEQVVITIRGTLSIEDCITDIECDAVEMEDVGNRWGFNGKGRWAHSGMMRAAEAIREDLEKTGLLNTIFGRIPEPSADRTRYAHYGLVTTGHSLGAGAAVILTLLLKSSYPHVHCYSFGTPGAVLDRQSCFDARAYATSISLGNDIICRLGFRSLCKLRDDILECIARAKVSKMRIMMSLLSNVVPSDLMYEKGNEPPSKFKQESRNFKQAVQQRLNSPDHIDLFLPGRIIHITKSKVEWTCCWEYPIYDLVEGNIEDFMEIPVSRTMIVDHLVDTYYQHISQILKYRIQANL